MDADESGKSSTPIETVKEVKASSVCKVCGNHGAVMYLGVKCCSPCKMFFRRNVDYDLNTNECSFRGGCDVAVTSRRACRYCRFKKCIDVGLQADLIRASRPHQDHGRTGHQQQNITVTSGANPASLPVRIPTLDLLRNDRSLLTTDQWMILSNVINACSDQSPAPAILDTMVLHSTYPSKIRLKMALDYFKKITGSLYTSAGPFIKTLPEFINMSINDQSALIERNIRCVGGFSGILVLREIDICTDPYYHHASVSAYGTKLTNEAMRIVKHADNDGTLIKLMLSILSMSTCSDHLDPNNEDHTSGHGISGGTRLFSNTLYLLQVQNIYTEMMFKYMLYRYGYKEATMRFASLIKSCLDQNLMVSGDGDLKQHQEMVQAITDQTERSLTLRDEPME